MNFPGQGYSTGGYPPPQQPYGGGYPAQQNGYPPQQSGYPPQQNGYPPQESGYPPQQSGYPPQQVGYPPQQPSLPYGGYSPQQGYPPSPQIFQSAQPHFDRNVSSMTSNKNDIY